MAQRVEGLAAKLVDLNLMIKARMAKGDNWHP